METESDGKKHTASITIAKCWREKNNKTKRNKWKLRNGRMIEFVVILWQYRRRARCQSGVATNDPAITLHTYSIAANEMKSHKIDLDSYLVFSFPTAYSLASPTRTRAGAQFTDTRRRTDHFKCQFQRMLRLEFRIPNFVPFVHLCTSHKYLLVESGPDERQTDI